MNIYDCFGTFDQTNQCFNIAIQTTNIGFDEFYVSQYYNICNTDRYAIVAILQTIKKNEFNIAPCKPNCALINYQIGFDQLLPDFLEPGDKRIQDIVQGDEIIVYTLHAIGFTLRDLNDKKIIEDYKADNSFLFGQGSPPSKGGKGVLV